MSSWRWRPALHGYAFHDGAGTAFIQLETRRRAPGSMPVMVENAKEAPAFDVAIVVAGLPTERYRLRGPLERLQRRLPALLRRRLRSRPAPTALPRHDWTWPSEVAADG